MAKQARVRPSWKKKTRRRLQHRLMRRLSQARRGDTTELRITKAARYDHVHPSGTVSGRFSASAPNVSNIPKADKEAFREAVEKDDNRVMIIGVDWSSMEQDR